MTADPLTTGFTQPQVERRYIQYLEDNHGDLSDLPRLCEVMANFGARCAMENMVIFSDIMPQLSRIEKQIRYIRSMLDTVQAEDQS